MIYNDEKQKIKLNELKDAIKDYLEKNSQNLRQYDIEMLNYSATELENPAKIDDDKYKIPHKYLYDQLSKLQKGIGGYNIDDIISNIATYKEYDGQIPKEKGELLENLFSDKDNYFYLHNINYRGMIKDENQLHDIAQNICKEGLRLTTMGNEVGKISYTSLNTKEDKGMLSFLPMWDTKSGLIIMQIPKEKVDNNENIIGSDSSTTLNPENPGNVLPEYVSGYIEDDKFIKNPVKKEDQKQYKYQTNEITQDNSLEN